MFLFNLPGSSHKRCGPRPLDLWEAMQALLAADAVLGVTTWVMSGGPQEGHHSPKPSLQAQNPSCDGLGHQAFLRASES